MNCEKFLELVSCKLGTVVKATKFGGLIEKVAVVSGAGGSFLNAAAAFGAQAFVTGECKHSDFVEACCKNLCLVAAGHFETENLICEVLAGQLSTQFTDVNFFVAQNCRPAHYFTGDLKWL